MSQVAQVQAVETLRDMESALGRFASEAREALASAELEIRRIQDWLQERLHHWQREVERWRQEVQRARAALERCQRSGYRDRDGRYHPPNCSAYEAALAAARRHLQQAEAELANTRKWVARVREAEAGYRAEARRLERMASADIPRARALLNRKIGDLEAYLAVSVAAFASVLPILVRAIPMAYDRFMGNLRSSAVATAREQEIELVKTTGRGTRNWSKSEMRHLRAGRFPKGYHGHHINNVSRFPDLAVNPDNITFVKPKGHFRLHRRDWRNATSGKMYNRKSLMVQWGRHKRQ